MAVKKVDEKVVCSAVQTADGRVGMTGGQTVVPTVAPMAGTWVHLWDEATAARELLRASKLACKRVFQKARCSADDWVATKECAMVERKVASMAVRMAVLTVSMMVALTAAMTVASMAVL